MWFVLGFGVVFVVVGVVFLLWFVLLFGVSDVVVV